MGSSLKGYVPALARLLGISPSALYERQRALVRAGLLQLAEGRGPGSGVRADSEGISLLIIAVLATDSLSETEKRVREVAYAKPVGGKYHPDQNFLNQLEFLLSTGADLTEICVSRTAARARITLNIQKGLKITEFEGQEAEEPALRIEATLSYVPIVQISNDIQSMIESEMIERENSE